ncbi:unnamed protein product [Effrenium voratum]|nr:unnamed protein product [Effrenium voratum]
MPSPVKVLPNIEVALDGGGTEFLQQHNLESDCWMSLHGVVYRATSMLNQHDGGRANVAALCGLDATASFDCVHDMGEIQEAVQDYGISRVGTANVVLGAGCTFQLQAGMLPDRQITWEELAMHSTTQDCWMVLGAEGIVWDVTAYLPKHTGGASSVGMHCGADATKAFDRNHKAGYMTTMAQKGGFPQGKISGNPPAPDTGTVQLTPLTMSDVAAHSLGSDCWIAVHGYVMDVTSYLDRHSGGRASIANQCGKDATQAFDSVAHPMSYITMMVQKSFASMKGCVGSCTTNGASVSGSGTGTGATPDLTGPAAQVPARSCRADEPVPPATVITHTELATHSTAADCWMVLGCGVYDISSYRHSGGNVVHSWCGTDGTTSFTGKHPWTYLQVLLNMNSKLMGTYGGTPVGSSVGRQNPVSLAEIAKHNTPSDCWSCIHGKVYELHFYMQDHDAGSAVIEPMCGEDATAYYAMAHSMSSLQGLPLKGSCDSRAEQAFTEQNFLDGGALLGYIVLPMLLNEFAMAVISPSTQDRLLRRPLCKPLQSRCLGNIFNSYLEMPFGVAFMLVWFLVVTAVLCVLWARHYNEYYLPDFALAGWIGRMTVYMISIATYLGTRRWSLAWTFYRISYEKTLKAHYVVGTVASIFMLLHGGMYLAAFGPADLPEHQATTAYVLLAFILIMFPFTINNFRVHCYSIFKVTHFVAPLITITATFHIMSLNVDGVLGRGFWVALVWIASASLFWIGDFLYSRYDVLLKPTVVIGTPRILPADGGPAHISVKLRKMHTTLFPGAWMSVASKDARSPLSHPFTAIVRKCGGLDREYAEVEFLFKVNEGKTWTQALHDTMAKQSPKVPLKFYLSGPYGGGLGNMDAMKMIIFVVGGVGVTPAASMVPYLIKRNKMVHVIWSCRSASLIQHVAGEYFNSACGQYFDRYPQNRNIHYSGKASEPLPPYVKSGRPDVMGVIQAAVKSGLEHEIYDVGVFVCGPNALVESSLAAADEVNADKTSAHVHVHAESFQM